MPDGADSVINPIALQSDGKLLVAGSFNTINGTSRQRIARLNADGGLDDSLIAFPEPNFVYTVALQSIERYSWAALSALVNGVAGPHVARLHGDSVVPSPSLTIARSNVFFIVSWPVLAQSFQLKYRPVVSEFLVTVAQPATTNAGRIAVTVPSAVGSKYFI